MSQMKTQGFLKGAMILTAATMVVKVIGMLYKIPLGNILGAGGMSHFMSAYSIFNPIYALSVSGLPVAVSKLVSESRATGRLRDTRRIRGVSLLLFLCTGLAGTLTMLFGARFFAGLIGNPGAAPAIAAMAPAIFFCCIISSFRGYYQGLHDMVPTATSQIVESVAKLVCGIAFSLWMLRRGIEQYAATGAVFGTLAANEGQARLLVLPWAAAGAVLGVTASTAVGAAYLALFHLIRGDGVGRDQLESAPAPRGRREIAATLVKVALPVCLAAAAAHVSALIDVATIMNRVGAAMARDAGAVLSRYAGLLPPDLAPRDLPSYLYGAFGYTSSLFNLVPALTATLGISALPALSSDWALHRRGAAAERARSVLKMSALIAIPAGLGLSVLAEPILALLYPARPAEVAIAAPLLRMMGVGAVLAGITAPMMSVFQAIGQTGTPVRLMLCGAALKAAVNYALLAVPAWNISAAPLGTIACYGLILTMGLWLLSTRAGIGPELPKTLGKPLICSILCALAANTSYDLLARMWNSRLITLASIVIGGAFYGIFVLLLKIITKNEALMLPNGKKIAKILEKLGFLG